MYFLPCPSTHCHNSSLNLSQKSYASLMLGCVALNSIRNYVSGSILSCILRCACYQSIHPLVGYMRLAGSIKSEVDDLANSHAQQLQTMIRNKYSEMIKAYGTTITWTYKLELVGYRLHEFLLCPFWALIAA